MLWRSFALSKTNENDMSYGYGWYVTRYKNRKTVFHGGSLPGFRSMYFRFPDERTAIIVLTNSEPANPAIIAQGIADMIL